MMFVIQVYSCPTDARDPQLPQGPQGRAVFSLENRPVKSWHLPVRLFDITQSPYLTTDIEVLDVYFWVLKVSF